MPNPIIRDYEIVKELGHGGYGKTYLATAQQRPGQPQCVVRQLQPIDTDPLRLQKAQKHFVEEARILKLLGNHDQIPQLWHHFEDNGQFYLVHQFIDGEDLHKELAGKKTWSEDEVIVFLRDVLEILDFIHEKGIIHRDLKPSNLIRRKLDSKIVIIYFGAVKQITTASVNSQRKILPTSAIDTGSRVSPKQAENDIYPLCFTTINALTSYIPPEQIVGRPSFASDIYALGIMAIEALTGKPVNQFRQDPKTGNILWQEEKQISKRLAKILDKMVQVEVGKRYKSAAEVRQALNKLPKLWYTTKPWFILGAAFIMSMIVFVVIMSTHKPRLFRQGEELLKDEKYKEAIVKFKKVLEIDPNDDKALTRLVHAYIALEKYTEIQDYCELVTTDESALKISPEVVLNCQGELPRYLKRYDEAIRFYDGVLESAPKSYKAQLGRGIALKYKWKYLDAIKEFDKILENKNLTDEQIAETLFYKGLALCGDNKHEEGRDAFKEAQELKPNYEEDLKLKPDYREAKKAKKNC